MSAFIQTTLFGVILRQHKRPRAVVYAKCAPVCSGGSFIPLTGRNGLVCSVLVEALSLCSIGAVFFSGCLQADIIYESCFSIAAPPFVASTLIVRLSFGGRNGGTTRRRMKTEIMLPPVRKTDPNDSD